AVARARRKAPKAPSERREDRTRSKPLPGARRRQARPGRRLGPLSAVRLDGGLATTLQRHGLPPFTPVNDWLLARPDAVRDAHAAFAKAGAELVLAGTFRVLPHLDARWPTLLERAVSLCLQGVSGRAEVWASIGPASTPDWRYLDA